MSHPRFTIISASAGSGKTHTLTQELIRRLANTASPLEPSQIIATTFTTKAAGELEERIQQGLIDAADDPDRSPAESARLHEQLLKLPGALIGTVNSVSDQIVRMFAVDAGLSPDLSVLSEATEKSAFAMATGEIIAAYEEDNAALLARMRYDKRENSSGFNNTQAKLWRDVLHKLIEAIRRENIALTELPGLAEESINELEATLSTAREQATEELRALCEKDPTCALLDYESADVRPEILEQYEAIAAGLQEELDAGAVSSRSVNALERFLAALPTEMARYRLHKDIAEDTTPWQFWVKATEGTFGAASGTAPVKDAVHATFPPGYVLFSQAFRDDAAALVRLTFAAAGECLEAYRDFKDSAAQIDFTDQEQRALHILRTNQAVREEIAARFELLIVDEFQDTNPIQLAVFMELAQLVSEVIWVGDPKQSIYAFRGSDPGLMNSALRALTDPQGTFRGESRALSRSWRSFSAPIALSNELFAPLFPEGDSARLFLPEPLVDSRQGGSVEVWEPVRELTKKGTPKKPNLDTLWGVVAEGLAQKFTAEGFPAHGCAVLVHKNAHAAAVAAALQEQGIPVATQSQALLETREGTLLRAALLWLVDKSSTQSLLEIISICAEHPAHRDWFEQLVGAADREARTELFRSWAEHESVAAIEQLAPMLASSSIPELVSAAIAVLKLPERIASWSEPAHRLATLDSLQRHAAEFAAQSTVPAGELSVLRFIESLADESATVRAATAENSVYVGTLFSAKGLEWDTVVLPGPVPTDRFTPAGVWVDPAPDFDVTAPLAGRRLMFWPHTLLDMSGAAEALLSSPLQAKRRQAASEEELRKLYVAFTRSARDTIIVPALSIDACYPALVGGGQRPLHLEVNEDEAALVLDNSQLAVPAREASLDTEPLITVPGMAQRTEEHVRIPVSHRVFPLDGEPTLWESAEPRAIIARDAHYPTASGEFIPAAFTPSAAVATPEEARAEVRLTDTLGSALVTAGGQDWDLVGNAVHAFLGVDVAGLEEDVRVVLAKDVLQRWGAETRVEPQQLLDIAKRWQSWVEQRFGAGAQVRTEVPFRFVGEDGTHAQGWIDALIVDAEGRTFLVDHKTYPGADPERHIRENYLGQMAAYARVLASAGQPVAGIFMHLPLRGEVWELSFAAA
ncbi:exodeoxyribonuclease V subunit beta [Corynebacterium sp.]|uniref:UvrD-helicase domain-containing protein n=1 Tax=Corynebacterium sp. TaxID=1720 RepID=UPI0026DB2A4B|nr:UvrD-helicase domain-containing protein [Corynebacterium sp.]MDO5031087.1 UvrD-helicase domain-containing protein [Corynebacterium sp.]